MSRIWRLLDKSSNESVDLEKDYRFHWGEVAVAATSCSNARGPGSRIAALEALRPRVVTRCRALCLVSWLSRCMPLVVAMQRDLRCLASRHWGRPCVAALRHLDAECPVSWYVVCKPASRRTVDSSIRWLGASSSLFDIGNPPSPFCYSGNF